METELVMEERRGPEWRRSRSGATRRPNPEQIDTG